MLKKNKLALKEIYIKGECIMELFQKKESMVIEDLKKKVIENINQGLYIESLRPLKSNSTFTVAPDGTGLQVQQLGNFILKWEHFQKIVEKANLLGGKMYRGDVLAMNSGTLGEEISYDTMEGFIASELLYTEEGMKVTRRSTYYSGILAWAKIVTLHRSKGKGSYITVNPKYCRI